MCSAADVSCARFSGDGPSDRSVGVRRMRCAEVDDGADRHRVVTAAVVFALTCLSMTAALFAG